MLFQTSMDNFLSLVAQWTMKSEQRLSYLKKQNKKNNPIWQIFDDEH